MHCTPDHFLCWLLLLLAGHILIPSGGRFVGRSEEEEEEVTAGAFRVVLLMCTQRIKYNEMIHKDTFASWLLCIFDGNAIS